MDVTKVNFSATPTFTPLEHIRQMMSSFEEDLKVYEKKVVDLGPPKGVIKGSNELLVTPLSGPDMEVIEKEAVCINEAPESLTNTTSPFDYIKYKKYTEIIKEARCNRKIFSIYGYYTPLRNALRKRGWIEKIKGGPQKSLMSTPLHVLLKNAENGNDQEIAAISRMLDKETSFFIWQPKSLKDSDEEAMPLRNRVRRDREMDFTLKEGLIGCIESSDWFLMNGANEALAPRFHRLTTPEELAEFYKDYRLTHCFALIRFVAEAEVIEEVLNQSATIDAKHLDFAISRVLEEVSKKEHEDIDKPAILGYECSDVEWNDFLVAYRKIISESEKVKIIDAGSYKMRCQKINSIAEKHWPTTKMDGTSNIWILKPSNQCRGRGILLMRDYSKIINHVKKFSKTKFIIQKYIEKPLLIYKTKFDIRQYMLITITSDITIWMYQDCYLRFSSQEYSLSNLQESIHLTNNSVQIKYKNGPRSEHLPQNNMWSLIQFESYLESIGKGDVWRDIIYPKMRDTIVSIVLASLDSTHLAPNSFELYGCDFLLNEEYEPILLEINSTPDLSASTSVTAQICSATLEDLVKVVVDRRDNPSAETGSFKIIHRVPYMKVSEYVPDLVIQGISIQNSSTVRKVLPQRQTLPKKSFQKQNKKPRVKKTRLFKQPSNNLDGGPLPELVPELDDTLLSKITSEVVNINSKLLLHSIDPSMAIKVIQYYQMIKQRCPDENLVQKRMKSILRSILGQKRMENRLSIDTDKKRNKSKQPVS